MATFANTTYNAARYAAIRPTYPRQLFDAITRYHERGPKARWATAVDLGCGTGQATVELTQFHKVIGVDPSSKMIEQAQKLLGSQNSTGQLEFRQSKAEELPFLEDGSVDLIVSAQAAHWFDWKKLWQESARVLRTHGTIAAWGYSEFRLARYPSATRLINDYSQGADPETSLGPHWERPGRTILDEHLVAIPDPEAVVPGKFQDFERIYFTGDYHPNLPSPRPVILRKKMTWSDLLSYLHTFSSFHTYQERYPADKENPEGDIAKRFWNRLKAHTTEQDGSSTAKDTDEIDVEWPMALLLARRV
ncbi:S-adenosyl-L-methionine-dependent methyltransferase [Phanerochaete sordida]|uniref:S-adenosyl-L-methionine-dependent methyltransferase n=1 Tax=Phanerochaete sordida TaxID=48140 RepID=A0A9P3LEG0_9APHY|nr:S-adenosyl-L-methionine-dependent methyltransferase [Phanerochaete sordida]